MAETALYNALEKYNSTIQNKYKDNWGTMVSFFEAKDTEALTKLSDNYMKKSVQLSNGEQERVLDVLSQSKKSR